MHNLTGKKFGKLTPIARAGSFYRCVCDCGKETTTRTSSLIIGKTKSCGCLQREMWEDMNRLKMTHQEKRAKARTYYLENAESITKASRQWYSQNTERAKENSRKYRESRQTEEEKNRRIRKAIDRLSRKHKLKSSGRVSKEQIAKLYFLQHGDCLYCGKGLDTGFHRDHRTPLARGGENTDSNIQLLCPKCNGDKGARDPDEFEASIGFIKK